MGESARLGRAIMATAVLVAGGCGDGGDACRGMAVPSSLVTGAALLRVELYAAGCAALGQPDTPLAAQSRTFAPGAPVTLDAPPGQYAVVVTSYADAAATEPLGTVCADETLAAGAHACLSLALGPVDLAGGADPSDLGALDLAAIDLGYVAGATLASDDFHRTDEKSWGVASDGQAWGASAGGNNVFSIYGNVGQVAAGGNATYPANLGPVVADAEVLASAIIESSGAHWGDELRNGGASTEYAAILDGTTLSIRRIMNGATAVLAVTNFTAAPGTSFSLRFRAVAGDLRARAWPTSGTEPAAWTLGASDGAPLGPGFGGMRFTVPGSTYVTVSAFSLVAE